MINDLSNLSNIAIFGGSFDPIHLGHIEICKCIEKKFLNLDKILFLPCFLSPFKESTIANSEHRMKMIEISIKNSSLTKSEICSLEVEKPEPSYSYKTIMILKSKYPNINFYWIIGTDQWKYIDSWFNSSFLKKNVTFIIVSRDHNYFKKNNSYEFNSLNGWNVYFINFNHEASSTKIRNDFESNSRWLDHEVVNYCLNNNLYTITKYNI